jgi:DNA invertase Pin-like site-specific DNA recombinase
VSGLKGSEPRDGYEYSYWKIDADRIESIAQFEREMMLERQREGVIKAKAAGKYKGRKPTPNAIRQEVIRLAGERMTKTAIAGQLNIGEATVYRILAGASKQDPRSQKG